MAGEYVEHEEDETADLLDYWRIVWRRRWAVVAICAVVVLATEVFTLRAKPIYVASAKILIERESPKVVQFEDVLQLETYDLDYYETQFKILQSETLAQQVIEKLNLENSPEFRQEQDIIAYYANPRTWFHLLIGLLTPLLTPPTAEQSRIDYERLAEQAKEEQLLMAFLDRLKVQPLRGTRIAVVSFEGYDAEAVTKITNTLADTYIEYNFEKRYRVSQQAVEWLTERLNEMKTEVEESEGRLQQYKTKHQLISLEDRQNIIQQKLAELNSELTKGNTEKIARETIYNQLRDSLHSPNFLETLPPVIDNPLIQELKNKYATLSAEYSELSERYKPKYPKMIRLRAQMDEVKQSIDQEVQKIARAIEAEYRIAKAREEMLEKSVEEQKQALLALGQKAIEYGVLKRQAESSNAMYDALLNRLKETDITADLKTGNIEILDRAKIPLAPSKPRKARNILFALVMGSFLGVGTAFLLAHLDNKVKLPQDVKRHLGTRCLGFVSDFGADLRHTKKRTDLITLIDGLTEHSESFRYIRSNLLTCAQGNDKGTALLVTSALPREGKTTVTANVAIALAKLEKRVLLVDADLRNSRLHRLFYLSKYPGLSDVILGQSSLLEAIADANVGELKILTAGSDVSAPAELLGSKKFEDLVAASRCSFDFILFDAPPVLSVSDPLTIAKHMDGTILVIESRKSPVQAARAGLERFAEIDSNIYGVILNRISIHDDGYHFYYCYRHHYCAKKERPAEV